ncbi:hypothetical protein EUGRSUZ_H04654 [Eucalyptus grandis]|uniref:Uncharacterized protein n=2 Tax=Eucalyptus grandis TaxID=71139 RepID=A0ACC3JX98_EUCGR|nr:hypothetical protein EUGRSUZ_H04654 [Eucalyptus grandis]
MSRRASLWSLIALLALAAAPAPALSLSPDGLSLLSLKSAVDEPPGAASAFADWNEDDPTPCRWTGVSCANVSANSSDDPRVVGLAVSGKGLRGYIPSELGTLLYLRRLNLHGNDLSGPIPDPLFNATSLHSLFLYGNNLSGPLPPSICGLPRLQNLDLSNNSFSGALPDGLRSCKQLQRLILADNRFSGEIPAAIWPALENLVQLDLSSNNFTGPIPAEIGQLKSLSSTLNLSHNRLSGAIPKALGDLPVTVSFDLKGNNLSGEIPQTGSFASQGPTAFLANPLLCGFPLQKACNSPAQSGAPSSGPNNSPTTDSDSRKGLSPGLIILISVADAAGVALLGLVVVYIYWKKKDTDTCSCTGKTKLGGGGGGGGCRRYKEFVAEVQAIGRVKHPNVVKLRAYYWAPDEKLLISDFISNGNLASALRGKSGQPSSSLSWSTRLRIAKGTARGLAYLHECSPRKFVHGDVKPSNILLDNEFQAYISDFGLNRLISITGNNPSSGGFIGGALPYFKSVQPEKANNYRAPEARVPGSRPTQKWDIYSFGVVLLELLTGKSPELSPTTSTSIEVPDIVRWVRKGFEDEVPLSDMVDPMLLQEVHAKKEVLAAFHVALACTEADPEIRPRMKTVSENLERVGT